MASLESMVQERLRREDSSVVDYRDYHSEGSWIAGGLEEWLCGRDEVNFIIPYLDARGVVQLQMCSRTLFQRFGLNEVWAEIARRDFAEVYTSLNPGYQFPISLLINDAVQHPSRLLRLVDVTEMKLSKEEGPQPAYGADSVMPAESFNSVLTEFHQSILRWRFRFDDDALPLAEEEARSRRTRGSAKLIGDVLNSLQQAPHSPNSQAAVSQPADLAGAGLPNTSSIHFDTLRSRFLSDACAAKDAYYGLAALMRFPYNNFVFASIANMDPVDVSYSTILTKAMDYSAHVQVHRIGDHTTMETILAEEIVKSRLVTTNEKIVPLQRYWMDAVKNFRKLDDDLIHVQAAIKFIASVSTTSVALAGAVLCAKFLMTPAEYAASFDIRIGSGFFVFTGTEAPATPEATFTLALLASEVATFAKDVALNTGLSCATAGVFRLVADWKTRRDGYSFMVDGRLERMKTILHSVFRGIAYFNKVTMLTAGCQYAARVVGGPPAAGAAVGLALYGATMFRENYEELFEYTKADSYPGQDTTPTLWSTMFGGKHSPLYLRVRLQLTASALSTLASSAFFGIVPTAITLTSAEIVNKMLVGDRLTK